jgi:integrase/recombinase XerD
MSTALQKPATVELPDLIKRAGERAAWRFLEFFTVSIRNRNTRGAYARAAGSFLEWCEGRGIGRIEDVQPVHVAGYIEQLQATHKATTVKQHLACIRMLFDWLVVGHVVESNPAHAVRGPRHSVMKGSTTVMSSQDASAFLKSIDASHVVGLRDRALSA